MEEVNAGVAALDEGEYATYASADRDKFKADIAATAEARRNPGHS